MGQRKRTRVSRFSSDFDKNVIGDEVETLDGPFKSIDLDEHADLHPFDGRNPERPLSESQRQDFEAVSEVLNSGFLDTLSPRQRQCFVDHVISADTLDVVSKRYRISISSVRVHINAAAAKIRQQIGEAHRQQLEAQDD
jgi:DNA-directed RNA polymerase specialized sigma24 family protein